MSTERTTRLREALAVVEEQRDDALVYLSAIKLLLEVVARGVTLEINAAEGVRVESLSAYPVNDAAPLPGVSQ